MYLSSLPMFYHFEWSPGSDSQVYWGLVDNFLAAMAALAAAAILRSARDSSLGWLTAGAFLLALCFLTKPAGVLLIASLAISWFLIVVLRWLWAIPSQADQRAMLRFLSFGFGIVRIESSGQHFIWGFPQSMSQPNTWLLPTRSSSLWGRSG